MRGLFLLGFAVLVAVMFFGCSSEEPSHDTVLGATGETANAKRVAGACCLTDGTCLVLEEADCIAQGGTFQGEGIPCDPNPCDQPPPPTGACCFTDGTCTVMTRVDCDDAGGSYQGDDSVCDPNPCDQPPPPTGACCFTDGTCTVMTDIDCADGGGAYQGDDSVCDPNPCDQPPEQYEGCGLGWWKNHHAAWEPTGYLPEDMVNGVFTIPEDLGLDPNDSLDNALRYPGGNGAEGGARLLLRTAVVALLNAAHPDVNYPLTEGEIIQIVNDALASMDRNTMKDARHMIDQHNAQGCPLH